MFRSLSAVRGARDRSPGRGRAQAPGATLARAATAANPRLAQAGTAVPNAFAAEVYAHRADLLRIAWLQLRDEHLAEDVVQETFFAALKSGQSFVGKSKLKTWLIGILKFKIFDALRSRARDPISISGVKRSLRQAFAVSVLGRAQASFTLRTLRAITRRAMILSMPSKRSSERSMTGCPSLDR